MTVEFHDQQGRAFHSLFQEWRRLHPLGFFLTFSAKHRARLHATLCRHSGDVDWTFEEFGQSLTSKRKVCEESEELLLAWADGDGVEVSRCADCLHAQPGSERPAPFSRTPGAVTAGNGESIKDVPADLHGQQEHRDGVASSTEPSDQNRGRAPAELRMTSEPLVAFSWGYWGWGNAVPQFLEAAAALEAARGFEAPVFADVRLRRNVRAPGFNGTAFQSVVGSDRYRWFHGLGNACIATGEAAVRIAEPGDADRLLEFIREQAVARRRVIFFCACPTDRLPPCHRHEVATLVLQAARARKTDLTVVEWPGGEPESRELRLTATQSKQAGATTRPLGKKLPPNGLATLPWGSTVLVRIGKNAFPTLTGPACFKDQWRLPKLDFADRDDGSGGGLEKKAREFRAEFSCNARRS